MPAAGRKRLVELVHDLAERPLYFLPERAGTKVKHIAGIATVCFPSVVLPHLADDEPDKILYSVGVEMLEVGFAEVEPKVSPFKPSSDDKKSRTSSCSSDVVRAVSALGTVSFSPFPSV